MLKQTDGSYACVAESASRFTLGEVSKSCPRSRSLRAINVLLCKFKICVWLICFRPRKNYWGSWDCKRNKEAPWSFFVEAIRFVCSYFACRSQPGNMSLSIKSYLFSMMEIKESVWSYLFLIINLPDEYMVGRGHGSGVFYWMEKLTTTSMENWLLSFTSMVYFSGAQKS